MVDASNNHEFATVNENNNNDNDNIANFTSASSIISKTLSTYAEKVSQNHIILFLLVISIVQLIAAAIKKNALQLNIFQMATMTGLFACIQGTDSIYEFIIGGLVASGIAFASFVTIESQIENPNMLAIIRFVNNIIIVVCLLFFDCFNVAALSYALAAPSLIPDMGIGYLISYFLGCLLSICLVFILSLVTPTPIKMKWT
jgi:hypothetical protein